MGAAGLIAGAALGAIVGISTRGGAAFVVLGLTAGTLIGIAIKLRCHGALLERT
jgi:hypothetical protein